MKKAFVLPVLLAAAGVVEAADIPENWRLREIRGRELYASFHPSPECSDWMKTLDWPMMKHLFQIIGHAQLPISEVVRDGKEYAVRQDPAKMWKDDPLTLQTALARNPKQLAEIEDFERQRPGQPYAFFFTGYGCPELLPETLPQLDRASVQVWKKEHPGFYNFYGYDEWDNHKFIYSWSTPRISDPKLRARIEGVFPLTDDYRKMIGWTDVAQKRLEQFYFGEKQFTGLVSTWPEQCFDLARVGARPVFYEAELGSTSSPWRWGGAAIRGASRQFDIPFGWYCATFINEAWTRDGKKVNGFIKVKSPTRRNVVEGYGCSRSLLARNVMYGYFIGANILQEECCWDFLGRFGKNGEYVPSEYAEDFNAPFAWNEKHDRGVPYTPLAILISVGEQLQRQHYVPHNRDKYSTFAFLDALVPPKSDDPVWCCDHRKGEEGCLFNSEFGEIADLLCADSGQKSADFLKALKAYPRAVLVGNFDLDKIDTDALEQYVKDGGTLYVEQRLIDLGYVSAWIRDAKGKLITVDSYLPKDFLESKDPWWPDQMRKLTSGKVDNRVIRDIYRSVQDDLLPVKVEGDIQWGVNRCEGRKESIDLSSPSSSKFASSPRWLVWLINNRGVTHFAGEGQEVDPKAASTVRITYRPTGKVYETTVKAGGWAAVEIADGDLR